MITSVKLKFGRLPASASATIAATPITVFVGPNNAGKSKILQELHRWCTSGHKDVGDVIVEDIDFYSELSVTPNDLLGQVCVSPFPGEAMNPDNVIIATGGRRQQINRESILRALTKPNEHKPPFCQNYLAFRTLILDGRNRINLVNDQQAGDLQQPPTTSFQLLFRDNTKRSEVRRIISEAFGFYFTIDPTRLGTLRLRLSVRKPDDEQEERGIDDRAVRFHSASLPIQQASDGVKAFTGIITEIIAGDPAILLIDEPEAFLHPALSSSLGKEIALATSKSEKRLFVSTHSANFVMGCIQSGAPVNIVRLTYRNGVATARVLPSEDILRLMRNPLLRSTGVLNGLFYEFVVVTEGDSDRAFYQEINERLLRFQPELGIPNCLFLNAQNKQTVRTIVRPLREMGIPTVAVVDIDVLKEGGSVWTDFLSSGFIPQIEREALANLRSAVKNKLDATGKDMKRAGGVDLLDTPDAEAANNLFDRLSQYGLFVVRKGELESWLKSLNGVGYKSQWLIDIFEKMGEDPETPGYVKPGSGDVWEFITSIRKWLLDPSRRGIPE